MTHPGLQTSPPTHADASVPAAAPPAASADASNTSEAQVARVGPPWTLTGDGYILLWRLPARLIQHHAFAPTELSGRYVGRYSIVILVDYTSSNVGPYREILFAPGRYELFDGRRYQTVTKIYVSSAESMINGRANWGIPKELAQFEIRRDGTRLETHTVSTGGDVLAALRLRSYPPGVPCSTRLLPARVLRFAQLLDGRVFGFSLRLRGTARLARVVDMWCDPRRFPNLREGSFLGGIRLSGFTMDMPRPTTLPGPAGT